MFCDEMMSAHKKSGCLIDQASYPTSARRHDAVANRTGFGDARSSITIDYQDPCDGLTSDCAGIEQTDLASILPIISIYYSTP